VMRTGSGIRTRIVRGTSSVPFWIAPHRHPCFVFCVLCFAKDARVARLVQNTKHQIEAEGQGFEPCGAVLEAACSPRSIPLHLRAAGFIRIDRPLRWPIQAARGELNPSPRQSQSRVQSATPQAASGTEDVERQCSSLVFFVDCSSDPGWNRTTDFLHVKEAPLPLGHGIIFRGRWSE
jgi:hypothetical protein